LISSVPGWRWEGSLAGHSVWDSVRNRHTHALSSL
jgi:hypothetical protein